MPSTAEDDRSPAVTVVLPDEMALTPLARRLVEALPSSGFVTLEGDLGAGKTTFVKAVAAAIGIDPVEVVSPTFGLIHVHDIPPRAGGPAVSPFRFRRAAAGSGRREDGGADGAAPFYNGDIAAAIVAEVQQHGGLLDLADLAAYEVIAREPVAAEYRGRSILTNPPPSAGGVLLVLAHLSKHLWLVEQYRSFQLNQRYLPR